jgi:hypothetical protein
VIRDQLFEKETVKSLYKKVEDFQKKTKKQAGANQLLVLISNYWSQSDFPVFSSLAEEAVFVTGIIPMFMLVRSKEPV